MSARMPSAFGMPHSNPSADSAASSSPEMMWIGTPGIRACERRDELPAVAARRGRPRSRAPRTARPPSRARWRRSGSSPSAPAPPPRRSTCRSSATRGRAEHRLLVEDRHRVAAAALEDDEANRVRPEIDHGAARRIGRGSERHQSGHCGRTRNRCRRPARSSPAMETESRQARSPHFSLQGVQSVGEAPSTSINPAGRGLDGALAMAVADGNLRRAARSRGRTATDLS